MKKILIILMIFLSTFTLFIKVALGYTIVDNTNDWVHWWLSQPLIEIVTNFMNWSITWEQAMQQWQDLIQLISNWWADFVATVDSSWILHVWCTNNWNLISVIPDAPSTAGSSAATVIESLVPPPPVITSSSTTSYWWVCSNYISSYADNWSICNVEWNWDSAWTINCKQINTWSPVSSSCWTEVCTTTTTTTDWVVTDSNENCSCDSWSCPSDATKPADVFDIKTVTMNLWFPITNNSNAYANNSDSNNITVNISGSTNQNKAINWIPTGITDIQDTSWLKTNRINNTWDNALNFDWVTTSWITWAWNSFNFSINWIKSSAPLKSNNSSINFKANWVDMVLSWINYHFEKPFTWEIKVWDNVWENWNWKIDIWTSNKFKLISKENNLIPETNFKIYDFISNINTNSSDLSIINKTLSWGTLNMKDWVIFYSTLNTSESATSLITPWIKIELPPTINYNFNWKNISYYLNDKIIWDNKDPLVNIDWKDFIWVNVIWTLQWDWKQTITWQENNFSNISKLESKTQIRKNAYSYISNMTSWKTLNWIYYYNGDKKISEINLTDIETIVIKDWNLIIDKNINNNIWIIILKDWYNIDNWYMLNWNIYVIPDVTYIKAIMYADWWFISVKNDWTIYTEDNYERTNDLKNQVIMEWTLFTKNTIGWAILAWWQYILPWDKKVNENVEIFFKAMTYDLNYIRRANKWCDKSIPLNNLCNDIWEYENAFIIKYNSEIQINPPKLFKVE